MKGLTIGIVLSYESSELLQGCTESLQKEVLQIQSLTKELQWILVRAPEAHETNVGFFPGEVIDSPFSNLAQNRNLILQQARMEALYLTDPDCRIQPGALHKLCLRFEEFRDDTDVYAFAGPNLLQFQNRHLENFFSWLGQSRWLNGGLAQIAAQINDRYDWHSPTCHILYRQSEISSFRFSEAFSKVGEDLEFHYRLSKLGKKILICSDSFVWHVQTGNLWSYLKKTFRYGTAQTLLLKAQPRSYQNRRLIVLLVGLAWGLLYLLLPNPFQNWLTAFSGLMLMVILIFELQRYKEEKNYFLYPPVYSVILCSYFLGQLAGLVIPLSVPKNAKPRRANTEIF